MVTIQDIWQYLMTFHNKTLCCSSCYKMIVTTWHEQERLNMLWYFTKYTRNITICHEKLKMLSWLIFHDMMRHPENLPHANVHLALQNTAFNYTHYAGCPAHYNIPTQLPAFLVPKDWNHCYLVICILGCAGSPYYLPSKLLSALIIGFYLDFNNCLKG